MSTTASPPERKTVYATTRVWNEQAFAYDEMSGGVVVSEDEMRAQHNPPLLYVVRVRSM